MRARGKQNDMSVGFVVCISVHEWVFVSCVSVCAHYLGLFKFLYKVLMSMSALTHISYQKCLSSKDVRCVQRAVWWCGGPTVASQQVEVGVHVLPVFLFQVLQLPPTVHRHRIHE